MIPHACWCGSHILNEYRPLIHDTSEWDGFGASVLPRLSLPLPLLLSCFGCDESASIGSPRTFKINGVGCSAKGMHAPALFRPPGQAGRPFCEAPSSIVHLAGGSGGNFGGFRTSEGNRKPREGRCSRGIGLCRGGPLPGFILAFQNWALEPPRMIVLPRERRLHAVEAKFLSFMYAPTDASQCGDGRESLTPSIEWCQHISERCPSGNIQQVINAHPSFNQQVANAHPAFHSHCTPLIMYNLPSHLCVHRYARIVATNLLSLTSRISSHISRRLSRTPVQYILGEPFPHIRINLESLHHGTP